MNKFKGILIQYIRTNSSLEDVSYFMSDGIFEFDILAENDIQAQSKLLNHFYRHLWFKGGDNEISIEDFEKLSIDSKEDYLDKARCVFEYIVYFNPEKNKSIKINI